jgi:hypothetical protein
VLARPNHAHSYTNALVLPIPQKVVRGYNFACGFAFTPTEDGQVNLSYIIHPDVGGWLPSSAVHKGSINAVVDIVAGLIDFASAAE